jgi:perosamine synthetase
MTNIPLFGVVNSAEIESITMEVLRSGKIASGEFISSFERGIGTLTDQAHVIALSDITHALSMALHLSGTCLGDEVLTTAFACLSTNAAITQVGATPIWVDFSTETIEFDLADLKKKISSKTKALITYHIAGYPQPLDVLGEFCRQHDIAMIEDCNNALFAQYDGQEIGKHGDFSCYSFYPTRQINAIEGAALICKNEDAARRAKNLRRFGIHMQDFRNAFGEINPNSQIEEIGWSASMSKLHAAIGCAQLSTAKDRWHQTCANVIYLTSRIQTLPGVKLVPVTPKGRAAYWALLLFVEQRDYVLKSMKQQGVNVSVLHQRNDVYAGFNTPSYVDLPNTTYVQQHLLCIPCGWWLSISDLDLICESLKLALK